MKILMALLLVAGAMTVRAASVLGPEIGDSAPFPKVSKWLQAPESAPSAWPKGKVIVLEFWSVTCAPCVEQIPHLNELEERFKNDPVQFIEVTSDDAPVVEAFLKTYPIHGWVGIYNGSIFDETNSYRIYAIPHTVLIDAQGRVAAVIDPRNLNEATIQMCLDGKPASIAGAGAQSWRSGPLIIPDDSDACPAVGVVPGQTLLGRAPLYQALIRPTSTNYPLPAIRHCSCSPLGASIPAYGLKDAILMVYRIPTPRLAVEAELPRELYDFYISLPPRHFSPDYRQMEKVFSEAVESVFGLEVKREMRTVEVFVLKSEPSARGLLARSTSGGKPERFDVNELVGEHRSVADLTGGIENALGEPVFDESGMTNLCSFDIAWEQKDFKHPNGQGAARALKELGLDLVAERRSVEFVAVREASE